MVGKTFVSILHEYCAKKKESTPKYEWIDSPKGTFTCRAYVMDIEADGRARSKRDAKHTAAANAIKKLGLHNFESINELPQFELMDLDDVAEEDTITTLLDYCVQHNHPLPKFEILQESSQKFVVLCTIATIQRIGVSRNKNEARQKAAAAIFNVIQDNKPGSLEEFKTELLDKKIIDVEYERYKKFKTYRELTEKRLGGAPGLLLCERHNYFANFYDNLKLNAWKVLNGIYNDKKEQVMDLFKALKITPKIKKASALNTVEHLICIDVDCDYDAHFVDLESNVYINILEYFSDMLD